MAELIGRRRCQIPEHRRQIASFQKQQAHFRESHYRMWLERDASLRRYQEVVKQKEAAEAFGFWAGMAVATIFIALLWIFSAFIWPLL
jgi:hypothetical protein